MEIQRSLNDIIMYAIDIDNRKMYIYQKWSLGLTLVIHKWIKSNLGYYSNIFGSDTNNGFVFVNSYQISATSEFQFNFGNGYFGTTAVSCRNKCFKYRNI